jgi:hypothetical protein
MNNPEQIISFLKMTGHWQYPNGKEQEVVDGPFSQAIQTTQAQKAIASFQSFEAQLMDNLCMKIHGRPAQFDGEIGPATEMAMDVPRCGHPDYGPNIQAATGNGSWAHCHNIGDFHAATIYIHENQIPSFVKPVFNDVWSRVTNAYADIGLQYIKSESTDANIDMSFVSRSNGWIGLAIVGQGQSCSSSIWCRFLATYQPNNVLNEWTTLLMHELGHNAGLSHSRNGIMNPSIIQGLAPTWIGDPSEQILKNYYGGKPINQPPIPPNVKKYWTHIGYKDNEGGTTWIPMAIPIPTNI